MKKKVIIGICCCVVGIGLIAGIAGIIHSKKVKASEQEALEEAMYYSEDDAFKYIDWENTPEPAEESQGFDVLPCYFVDIDPLDNYGVPLNYYTQMDETACAFIETEGLDIKGVLTIVDGSPSENDDYVRFYFTGESSSLMIECNVKKKDSSSEYKVASKIENLKGGVTPKNYDKYEDYTINGYDIVAFSTLPMNQSTHLKEIIFGYLQKKGIEIKTVTIVEGSLSESDNIVTFSFKCDGLDKEIICNYTFDDSGWAFVDNDLNYSEEFYYDSNYEVDHSNEAESDLMFIIN